MMIDVSINKFSGFKATCGIVNLTLFGNVQRIRDSLFVLKSDGNGESPTEIAPHESTVYDYKEPSPAFYVSSLAETVRHDV